MKDIKKVLENKWGAFVSQGNYLANMPLPFISKDARLNVLFLQEIEAIKNAFAEKFQSKILPELFEFYQHYNGCRLFFSSLNIYGVQFHHSDIFEPFDLLLENYNIQTRFDDNNYVFFASLGGNYVFAYRKDELSRVYAFEKGHKQVLKVFDGFKAWFNYYFDALLNEYDTDGKKLHPNDEFKQIPSLYHVTYKLF